MSGNTQAGEALQHVVLRADLLLKLLDLSNTPRVVLDRQRRLLRESLDTLVLADTRWLAVLSETREPGDDDE